MVAPEGVPTALIVGVSATECECVNVPVSRSTQLGRAGRDRGTIAGVTSNPTRVGSAGRRATAALVLWVVILGFAGPAMAQEDALSTEAAVGLAVPDLVSGVYAQEGADVNLSTLSTLVRGADAAELAVYVAVYADPVAEPDAVARSLLTVVSEAEASATPVLVVVYAPDQFGHADRGIGQTEMNDALADAQEPILAGNATQGTEELIDSLSASEGRRWGRILLALGIGTVILALGLVGGLSERFGGRRRRARRRDELDHDAELLSPRILKVAERTSLSGSAEARASYHDLSARYGLAREQLEQPRLRDRDLDEIERDLLQVSTDLDALNRAAVPGFARPPDA